MTLTPIYLLHLGTGNNPVNKIYHHAGVAVVAGIDVLVDGNMVVIAGLGVAWAVPIFHTQLCI